MNESIAIFTLHRVKNYGSVLQAYALQKVIRDEGYRPFFVDYLRPDLKDGFRDVVSRSSWNGNRFRRLVFRAAWGKQIRRQREVFNRFIADELVTSETTFVGPRSLTVGYPEADVYVVGSDQVWNGDYNVGGSEPFFLEFAPQSSPKISYAASFGKDILSPEEVCLVRAYLPTFASVSVREESAVRLLAEQSIEATHVLDPTLLLSKEEWQAFSDGPPIGEPYILAYQLNQSAEFDQALESVKIRLGLPVRRILTRPHRFQNVGSNFAQPSVKEWVSVFRNAAHVVTDSFHGTAFSVNLEREFTVVKPQLYSERLTSFLGSVDATCRIVGGRESQDAKELDWSRTSKLMDEKRSASRLWLIDALEKALAVSA